VLLTICVRTSLFLDTFQLAKNRNNNLIFNGISLLSSSSSLFFLDGYGIAVIAFLALSLVFGILITKLVKKRSTYSSAGVLGKVLPIFFIGTILAIQSIEGNSSLGSVSLVYQFGFWAGAIIPIGLAISLILTGVFYGQKLNKMTLLTLPDFYYRRYGFGAEGISSLLMIVGFIVLVAGEYLKTSAITWSTFISPFTVSLHSTSLTLNSISSVPWSTTVTVTGQLIDNNVGTGIAGQTIMFDGTGASTIASTTTNSDGTFTATGFAPSNVATGWTVQGALCW
jgi:hypothetical protein